MSIATQTLSGEPHTGSEEIGFLQAKHAKAEGFNPVATVSLGVNLSGSKLSWKQAKAHEQQLYDDFKAAHEKGKRKKAAYLQHRYLTSYDARLVAARTAFNALRPRRRPPMNKLPELAASLNALRGTDEKVIVRWKQKASNENEFRPLMDFGIENRALQYLVSKCLKVRADLHPMQFAVYGGRDKAVLHACEALVAGFKHVAEMDIHDCYSSFDGETLSGLLPIPKEVTEKVILSRSLNLYPGEMYVQYCDGVPEAVPNLAEYLAEARQGIAQGSAVSSVVAEILLAPAIAQLPDFGVAVAYADNILLMAQSSGNLVTMRKALRALLDSHPAGPLILNQPKIYKPGQPVKFLGYKLAVNGAKCDIEPTQRNLLKFKSQYARTLKRIQAVGTSKHIREKLVTEIQCYVKSWSHGFALWPGAEQHRIQHLAMVKETVSAFGK